jgi:signal transduction histidine kinase/DNA-binding NarL/FixJ family response regulator
MLQEFKFSLNSWWSDRLKLSSRQWLLIVIPLLALAFLPLSMFYAQYRNNALKPLQYSIDSIFPMSYLLEREHARFSFAVHEEFDRLTKQTPASVQALRHRYEILVSRFLVVKNTPSLDHVLKSLPEFALVNASMDDLIKNLDPIMAKMDKNDLNPDDFKVIFKEIEKNTELLLDLTNSAETYVYHINDERAALVETQGKWIFGLIAAQWFLLIGALMALILYIGKQRAQNVALLKVTKETKAASLQAEQANKAKGMFLANMSHELRTPFQGMMGMLHLLSETPLTNSQQDYANTALSSARHLLGILNDILDTSAIESGAMALNIAPLNLPSLISEVEALMQSAANQKKIDLRVVGKRNLPEWIEGDSKRLSQILYNLLSNAIKFTEAGFVRLELNVLPPVSEGQLPVLSCKVTDSGIGMNDETVKSLFARFHQGDNTIHRRYGGSGLGLEISLNLARLMGGGISVESIEDRGTTFTFEFPYQIATAQVLPLVTNLHAVKNLRILIAEDHPINVKYLEILLKKMGHTTLTCENGARVLECLKVHQVDVILMDLHMPVMDGISTTRAVRNLGDEFADVKIIMVSADILPEARRLAFDAGVTEFLSKPVQMPKLRQALYRNFELDLNQIDMALPKVEMPDEKSVLEVFNARIFREFQELMPAEMVKDQLDTFFREDQQAIQIISKAIDSQARDVIVESAHTLKGVCWLLGLTAMANTLADIEKGGGDLSMELLDGLLTQFQDDIDQTRDVLNSALLLH